MEILADMGLAIYAKTVDRLDVGQGSMSFRARLTTFFAVIVVVPMVAFRFMVFGLVGHRWGSLCSQKKGKNRTIRAQPQTTNVVGAEYAVAMGLLDDAIREHLELKRRRGADPAEIERSEREALGPVRRAPEDLDPTEFEPHAEAEEGEEYEYEAGYEHENGHEHEASYAGELHETELLEPEPPEYEPPGHEAALQADEPEPRAYDEPTADHEPLPEEEPFAQAPPAGETPPPHPAPGSGHLSQETMEYELEDHPEAGESHEGEHPLKGEHPEEGEHPQEGEHAEGEDVLEETPEFLQDTPEHDRLWFEQRPPRDFDFDG